MLLQKASKAEAEDEFAMLDTSLEQLKNQRTARYMTLAITKGLGASTDQPVEIGLDCSTYARLAEINYNYNNEYKIMRRYLFFTHRGFGLSNAFNVGDEEIQYFRYNETKKRFDLEHPTMEGYIYCNDLPAYAVEGIYDEFMDNFSMKLRASFGEVMTKYSALKDANKKIKSLVVTTDYKQRIPVLDADGNYVIDPDTRLPDYNYGDNLGEGFLFSFDAYQQFDFYYLPVEVIKISEDRLRFVRKANGAFCTADATDPTIGESIRNSDEFNNFVDYLCNEQGWLVKKRAENGILDFDFVSLENTENYFYTRLY